MAVYKCKMCGANLTLAPGEYIATCEYCGITQTVPAADDEKKLLQFERAERLRRSCEFDKAAGIYESIVADHPQEAEAYWGLVLCKYGVEYVDDPASGKKIPTCHRSSFESVLEDPNFELVLENADSAARRIYREEAKALETIRRGIVEVSSKEEPYDIFICYKETDEDGGRTLDSVLAQDIYNALTEKGYRVFFSRITLEDKLGQEYEPYIFAALNSARVMLAIGTDYEYYNAVWVKNEWSRYLKLIEAGQKKTLIPCFKGIDAYDIPKEFAKLQAQDLGKVGAMQDLLRGIDKIIDAKNVVTQQSGVQTDDVNRIYLYNSALEAIKSKKISAVKGAVEKLESLGAWSDAPKHLEEARARLKKLKKKRRGKRIAWLVILFLIVAAIAGGVLYLQYQQAQEHYLKAENYLEEFDYYNAYRQFKSAGGHKDAPERMAEAQEDMLVASEAYYELAESQMYWGTFMPAWGEMTLNLIPTQTTFNGQDIYYQMELLYIGFVEELDIHDPASLAAFCGEGMQERMLAGELIREYTAGIYYDIQNDAFLVRGDEFGEYELLLDKDSGTITFEGEGVIADRSSYVSWDVMSDPYLYYEVAGLGMSWGMTGEDGKQIWGTLNENSIDFALYDGAESLEYEAGFAIVDMATGAIHISAGDPAWMLVITPGLIPLEEAGETDGIDVGDWLLTGYTAEVIGEGPDVAGAYIIND